MHEHRWLADGSASRMEKRGRKYACGSDDEHRSGRLLTGAVASDATYSVAGNHIDDMAVSCQIEQIDPTATLSLDACVRMPPIFRSVWSATPRCSDG